jgi:hypothetical protein
MKVRARSVFGPFFVQKGNSRRAAKRKTKTTHYAAERLESRLLLSTSWKFPSSGDWDNPSDWTNGIPTAGEDVTVPLIGTYTITHGASSADSFGSLTSTVSTVTIALTNGSLIQTGSATTPASQVSSTFTMTGGTLSVAGGTFTASGATTLSNANLSATSGGQIFFPEATTYTSTYYGNTIQASGAGSLINLSALTSFGGGSGGDTTIAPSTGGEIDLSGVINGATNITVADATSTLGVAGITQLNGVNLTLSSTPTLNFVNVTSLTSTNLSVSGGGKVLFPKPTTYTSTYYGNTIQASGAGSLINLSSLTSFGGGSGGDTTIAPSTGGEIDLAGVINGATNITVADATSTLGIGGVTQLNGVNLTLSSTPTLNFADVTSLNSTNLSVSRGGKVLFPKPTTYASTYYGNTIQASGVGSLINLSALTSFGGGSGGDTTIAPSTGGEIDLSGVINGATNITVADASSTLGVAGITQLNGVNLTLSSTPTLNFVDVTSLTSTNLSVSGGGKVVFDKRTTYTSTYYGNTIQASGKNSLINLSELSTFGGGTGGDTTIAPSTGGEIDLAGVINGATNITVADALSTLGVAGITQLNGVNLTLSSTLTLNFANVTSLTNTNLSVSGGGKVLFPKPTTYTSTYYGNTIQASGTGSLINLSALTSFGGGNGGTTTISASTGGEIDLAGPISGSVQITVATGGIVKSGPTDSSTTVNISGTGSILEFNPGANVYSVSSFSMTGGTLDLANNELLISYGSTDPSPTILSELATGSNDGAWNGTGIMSSTAAANHLHYGVAFADGADGFVKGITSGTIELKYDLIGDVNLDGEVNGTDFGFVAAYFGMHVTDGWAEADFNYDGVVNGTDFSLLAGNFGKTTVGIAVEVPTITTAPSSALSNSATQTLQQATAKPGEVLIESDTAGISKKGKTSHRRVGKLSGS